MAHGKVITDAGVKIFQIETTLNTGHVPSAVRLPDEARVGVDGEGQSAVRRVEQEPGEDAQPDGPSDLPLDPRAARHDERAGGEVDAVHEETLRNVHRQHLVEVEARTDIVTMGLPYIGPTTSTRS